MWLKEGLLSTFVTYDLASAIQAFNVQQIDTIIRPSVSVVGDHFGMQASVM
jgi:hypothetical protein